MNTIIHAVVAVGSGALIGGFTNWLAIKMLFRPREAKFLPRFLGGGQLPLTPGLIPKNKARLAEGISSAVSEVLSNSTEIKAVLTSEETAAQIREALLKLFTTIKYIDRPVNDYLNLVLGEKYREQLNSFVREKANEAIDDFLNAQNFWMRGAIAIFKGEENLRDDIIRAVVENIEPMLETEVCEIEFIKSFDTHANADKAVTAYLEFVRERFDEAYAEHSAVISDKVAQVAYQSVMNFDPQQVEGILMGILSSDLKYITWIGAVLGGLIGVVNLVVV